MQEYKVKVFDDRTEWRDLKTNLLHRIEGPAVEWVYGDKLWYQNGDLHRTDGPAAEYSSGNKQYFIEGVLFTEQEFKSRTQPVSTQSCAGKVIEVDGKKYKLVEVLDIKVETEIQKRNYVVLAKSVTGIVRYVESSAPMDYVSAVEKVDTLNGSSNSWYYYIKDITNNIIY